LKAVVKQSAGNLYVIKPQIEEGPSQGEVALPQELTQQHLLAGAGVGGLVLMAQRNSAQLRYSDTEFPQ
jgi:hypothetical protein